MIYAAFIHLALCAYALGQIVTAPEGYEDNNGFHYGKEPNR